MLSVDFNRSNRRDDHFFCKAVDVCIGKRQAVDFARFVVPLPNGRIDLPREIAGMISEQIFVLQSDRHVQNVLVGRGKREQVSIFHQIKVAEIAKQVCGVLSRNGF